jgi:hypothetical protein
VTPSTWQGMVARQLTERSLALRYRRHVAIVEVQVCVAMHVTRRVKHGPARVDAAPQMHFHSYIYRGLQSVFVCVSL